MSGCYIQGRNGIRIGKNCWFGPNLSIISSNHDLNDYRKHSDAPPIVIGDNCWLGAGCIILPGVELGDHVVVAAGAVVTKSFASNCVVGGVPARKLKDLPCYGAEEENCQEKQAA